MDAENFSQWYKCKESCMHKDQICKVLPHLSLFKSFKPNMQLMHCSYEKHFKLWQEVECHDFLPSILWKTTKFITRKETSTKMQIWS